MNFSAIDDGQPQVVVSSLGSRALVELSGFSALAAKAAAAIGLGQASRRDEEITRRAIGQALDRLASVGFPEDPLDAPAFKINPSSLFGQFAQTLTSPFALGAADTVVGTHVSEGAKRLLHVDKPAFSASALMPGSASFFTVDTTFGDPAIPARQEHSVLVSLRAGSLAWDFDAMGLKLGGDLNAQFMAGHELGHALSQGCGLARKIEAFCEERKGELRAGSHGQSSPSREEARLTAVGAAAEELYADAVGAMACAGRDSKATASKVDLWRSSALFDSVYLRDKAARAEITEWTATATLSFEQGAPELAARCFWTAFTALTPAKDRVLAKLAERRLGEALLSALGAEPESPKPARPTA